MYLKVISLHQETEKKPENTLIRTGSNLAVYLPKITLELYSYIRLLDQGPGTVNLLSMNDSQHKLY